MLNKLPTTGSFLGPGGNGNLERLVVYIQVKHSAVVKIAVQNTQGGRSAESMAADPKEGVR